MIAAVIVALVACIGFAALAPLLAGRLPPVVAVRFLVPGSLMVAGITIFVLGEVALFGIAQLPPFAALGLWSPRSMRRLNPFPDPVAVISLALLATLAVVATAVIVHRVRALVRVYRSRLGGSRSAGHLVVVDDDRLDAFTIPGPGGRVIITAGLLAALSAKEQQVVLAHEMTHLRYRHVWWRLAADLAAAINPMLRPTATAVAHATERWADEAAAVATGDRRLVARTVARVALAQRGPGLGARLRAAVTGGDVPRRVRALLAPAPPRTRSGVLILAALLLAAGAATGLVADACDAILDLAVPRA